MSDAPVREEGFYWVVLGRNPPEVAWERGEWWLAGDAKPWQPDAVTAISERLIYRQSLKPVSVGDGWMIWRGVAQTNDASYLLGWMTAECSSSVRFGGLTWERRGSDDAVSAAGRLPVGGWGH